MCCFLVAHSSFFDLALGAVDSPGKSVKEGEGSCPVLDGDSEADAVSRKLTSLLLSGGLDSWN